MSTAGNWSSGRRQRISRQPDSDQGFTLLELTVVMALMGVVFFFAIPKLQNEILTDPVQKTSRWLLSNSRSLKERSYREKKDYALFIDTDAHALWTSQRVAEEKEDAPPAETKARKYQLPDSLRILNVEFPGNEEVSTGIAEIVFYAKGYSQTAFIHMEDGEDRRLSFLIEPFLPNVRYLEAYVGFEN